MDKSKTKLLFSEKISNLQTLNNIKLTISKIQDKFSKNNIKIKEEYQKKQQKKTEYQNQNTEILLIVIEFLCYQNN